MIIICAIGDKGYWIPAYAGMTILGVFEQVYSNVWRVIQSLSRCSAMSDIRSAGKA